MIEKRRSLRSDPAFMLAVLYTCGFLGMCFLVILKDIGKESAPVVQQLLSIMSMIQAGIAGYFYGSSKAAADNQASAARILESKAPVIAPATDLKADDVKITAEGTVNVEGKKP